MTQAGTTLTDADNGRTIDTHVGDTLVLRLPENATTGYRRRERARGGARPLV